MISFTLITFPLLARSFLEVPMNGRTQIYSYNLAVAIMLALLITGCSVRALLPTTKINTGPIQAFDIEIPLPETPSSSVNLNLEFLMGDLKLAPGTSTRLVSGTAEYNAVEFEPKIEGGGASYILRSGDVKMEGIPDFNDDLKNEWDLKLADLPMSLKIKAGPYSGSFELGGLSLERLEIDEAGSNTTGDFSEPNHVPMTSLIYTTGGSSITLRGLANANFEQMIFAAGAGSYILSFDGELLRDANVTVDAGVSTVTIIVPAGVNAQVTFDGGLSSVNIDGNWMQNENVYTLMGSGPTITIQVKLGIGTLNLISE
jgi:hypothetical protein